MHSFFLLELLLFNMTELEVQNNRFIIQKNYCNRIFGYTSNRNPLFQPKDHMIYLAPAIRLVAANHKITVRAQSAINWRLYTEGKRSAATERLGLGLG